MKERGISVTKRGYTRFLKAAQRRTLNTAKIKMDFLCYLRAIQGHSGGIPLEPEIDGLCIYSSKLEKVRIS